MKLDVSTEKSNMAALGGARTCTWTGLIAYCTISPSFIFGVFTMPPMMMEDAKST